MYEELIKRLREYSTARKGEIAELTEEAADAIEELQKVANKLLAFEFKLDGETSQVQVIKDMKKYGLAVMRPKTNADRIRAMTDEKLAHFMTPENYKFPCPPNHIDCQYELIPCWMCWAKWLKAPAEEGK